MFQLNLNMPLSAQQVAYSRYVRAYNQCTIYNIADRPTERKSAVAGQYFYING